MRVGTRRLLAGLVVAGLLLAACGGDDGESVRDSNAGATGAAGGSASASGTGAASGPATTAPGDTATAAAACKPVGGSGGRAVSVGLKEFSVAPKPASAPPGKITFTARNLGTMPHELVLASAASPSALPTGANGAVDTAKLSGQELLGEVEPFPAGSSCTLTATLTPGSPRLYATVKTLTMPLW